MKHIQNFICQNSISCYRLVNYLGSNNLVYTITMFDTKVIKHEYNLDEFQDDKVYSYMPYIRFHINTHQCQNQWIQIPYTQ